MLLTAPFRCSKALQFCVSVETQSRVSCITCGDVDGLADQADAGVVASHHCDGVLLPARQVREITVGVGAVTFSVVAQAAPSIDGIRCGTTGSVPCDPGDTGLAVHSCCEVGGNTRGWWREREVYTSWSIFTLHYCYFYLSKQSE